MPFNKAEVGRITALVIAQASTENIYDDAALRAIIRQELPDDDPTAEKLRQVILKRVQTAISHPESGEFVVHLPEFCDCPPGKSLCADACAVDAIRRDEQGKTVIDRERCVDCGLCVDSCQSGAFVERTHSFTLAEMLKHRQEQPVYAIIAPAFVAQFGLDVTTMQVKAGLRRLGFTDVLEVALAADIITTLESEEYLARQRVGEKFVITSCCCPAFIKLVEKHRPNISHLVSDSVSPMIALGRLLKQREPGCLVAFIGPCLAKRAEAKRPELSDAIDSVLTFKEIASLLQAGGIDLHENLDQSIPPFAEASHDGRVYAHIGGVSMAIQRALVERLNETGFRPLQGNGLKECALILAKVEEGTAQGNFMEGMACVGGCVGGPGNCAPVEEGAKAVDQFANRAEAKGASTNQLARAWHDAAKKRETFSLSK